jgi:uncharacterized protein (DUF433 family)
MTDGSEEGAATTMSNVTSIFGDRDPREVPLYTIGQAAGYLHLPPSTVRAWSVGADYPRARGRTGRFKELLHLPGGSPTRLTFSNLVEAYVLAVMRRHHSVPLKHVRQAIANVTKVMGDERPLLSREFATDGVRLYLTEMDKLLEISTGDGRQYAIPQIISRGLKRIERNSTGVVRFFPFVEDPEEEQIVAIDPRRSFGRPTISGSGVTVDVVADLVNAGEPPDRVAREFGITRNAVNSAVLWQRRLAA